MQLVFTALAPQPKNAKQNCYKSDGYRENNSL